MHGFPQICLIIRKGFYKVSNVAHGPLVMRERERERERGGGVLNFVDLNFVHAAFCLTLA